MATFKKVFVCDYDGPSLYRERMIDLDKVVSFYWDAYPGHVVLMEGGQKVICRDNPQRVLQHS